MTVSGNPPLTLEDQLRQIVLDSSSIDESDLRDDTDLLATVDSLGVAELFQFVEERLGRQLAEEEMNRETFGTIAAIVRLIRAEAGD
jgi:acyl carrier protein